MKVKGNGQAKVLTAAELERLFKEGLTSKRDRALFAICLFTGCRISEALALETTDVKNQTITFRKSTTKGKLKTRQVSINPAFGEILQPYQERVGLRTRVLYRPPSYRTGLIFGNTATRNELTNYTKSVLSRIGDHLFIPFL